MSTILRYLLRCDAEDCSAVYTAGQLPGARPIVSTTREAAACLGWSHAVEPRRGGGPARQLDYCPPCTKERRR